MRHICFALIAICIVFTQPVFGQSRQSSPGAMLVYLGKDGKEVLGELQTLTRNAEFVEINLRFVQLEPESQEAGEIRRHLGLEPTSTWALADSRGRCLIQGDKLPGREAISQALESAGIRSPTAALRDFLRKNPDHVNAKKHLLPRLRKLAETRTIDLLKLNVKTSDELDMERRMQASRNQPTEAMSVRYGQSEYIADTSGYGDAKLGEKDDAEVWGEYARELETLFRTGDWRHFDLYNTESQVPAEVCSQLMRSLYRCLLPQVLLALEERPENHRLWAAYAWMRGVLGDNSPVQQVLDTLAPTPTTKKSHWPPKAAYDLFTEEAREQNHWTNLADLLWKRHRAILFGLYPNLNSDLGQMKPVADYYRTYLIDPLLKSLIRASRIDDAEYIITNIAGLKFFPDFTSQAAAMASECGRPDLESKWSNLQINKKTTIENSDDLEALIYGVINSLFPEREPTPCLFLINLDASNEKQLSEMISSRRTYLRLHFLDKNESNLMLMRQNWSGDETRWVLLNIDGKMISSGMGLPSENDLDAVIEQIKSERLEILRQFVRQHPNQVEAKNELLLCLSELAFNKTRSKVKELQNSDKLSSEDDFLIWGEYASLFRQLVISDNLLIRDSLFGIRSVQSGNITRVGMSNFSDYITLDISLEVFNYSSIMTSYARELLPIVSSNILKQPTSTFSKNGDYWLLWTFLSDPNSSAQARDLIDSITVSPFDNKYNVPSVYSLQYLLARYKSKENWQGIANVLEAYWENLTSAGELTRAVGIQNLYIYVMPLMEAYLNLKQDGKLDNFIDTFKQTQYWNQHTSRIAELFKQYGRDFK